MKDFLIFLGTFYILSGSYVGLAMAGILPPPYDMMGGWFFGLLPVICGMGAMAAFRIAGRY